MTSDFMKEYKGMIITVAAVVVVAILAVSGLFAYSGMKSPLTVIESSSMQHSVDTSEIGIIDTGDMVVMVSPGKASVTTYVEGAASGYSKFGSYGDVIIYYREAGRNPVIHRAILWLDYEGGKWSAPSLRDYPGTWSTSENSPWNDLTGTLTLKGLPGHDGTVTDVSIAITGDNSLTSEGYTHSGYLTKGDNNNYFDQLTSIFREPVQKTDLKAVAGFEIPWLGCVKLLLNNKNVNMIPHNSIPSLAMFFLDIIALFMVISIILDAVSLMHVTETEEPVGYQRKSKPLETPKTDVNKKKNPSNQRKSSKNRR